MASSRGVFCVSGLAQRQKRRQTAVNLQLELAQPLQRDEVHPVDQLAQFRAHLLAVFALDGLVQILGKPPISVSGAGVQLDHRRGGVGRQSGLDLAAAGLQRRADRLQFFRLDRAVQAHGLRALQFALDLRQFAFQRRPFNLTGPALRLCGGVKGPDGLGDRFRRQQVGLDAGEDALFHSPSGDDLAVGAGPAIIAAAAVVFAAFQRHGGPAQDALHQSRQHAFGFSSERPGLFGLGVEAGLNGIPELLIDDAQVRDGLAQPFLRRVQHR
nr:hypothetical protein [Brevundimonas diminuta]